MVVDVAKLGNLRQQKTFLKLLWDGSLQSTVFVNWSLRRWEIFPLSNDCKKRGAVRLV